MKKTYLSVMNSLRVVALLILLTSSRAWAAKAVRVELIVCSLFSPWKTKSISNGPIK